MAVIGITGNIGSGKSSACAFLREQGAYVIDADVLARQIVEPGQAANAALREHFGAAYFDEAGNLLRRKLGELVFNDAEQLARLNEITHPALLAAICQQLRAQQKTRLVVLEAAILLEVGWQYLVDEVWLITAADGLRIQRIMARDGFTAEQAAARIASQMPQQDKVAQACRVFVNDGTDAQLHAQLAAALQEILE